MEQPRGIAELSPADWQQVFEESEADLALGRTYPAAQILKELQDAIDRLETKAKLKAASQRIETARPN